MAMQHPNTNDAFTPHDFGKLLNAALQSESVALQVSTVVKTDKVSITFPIWDEDPAVNWLTELGTITATDGNTEGVTVTPSKVGGITRLSNELADDSSPEVAELAVRGLVNQISHAVDTAFVGDTTANGPAGLLSIAATEVSAGSAFGNTDPFVQAVFAAKAVGAKLTYWLMAPGKAQELAELKRATGSNESLIAFDARGELSVLGLPVLTHPGVDAETAFWGIPSDRVVTVLRKDAKVSRSKDSGFYNDALDVRAITRVGVGFLHEAAIVHGTAA